MHTRRRQLWIKKIAVSLTSQASDFPARVAPVGRPGHPLHHPVWSVFRGGLLDPTRWGGYPSVSRAWQCTAVCGWNIPGPRACWAFMGCSQQVVTAHHKKNKAESLCAGRFSFALLCYLSLTMPISVFRGCSVLEPRLILNLVYDDIIIFYGYKLTVGFNLARASAASRGSSCQLLGFPALWPGSGLMP